MTSGQAARGRARESDLSSPLITAPASHLSDE